MQEENKVGNKLDFVNTLTVFFTLAVLFLHHDNYTFSIFPESLKVLLYSILPGGELFMVPIAGFIFLSGYKLTLSRNSPSPKQFWLRRFIRIYPLYVIAIVLFAWLIYPHSSFGNLVVHALALQILFPGLFGNNFQTLYYVGLLSLYYLIYRFTYRYLDQPKRYLTIHGMLFLVSFLFHIGKPFGYLIFAPTYFMYYPFFICGVFSALYRKEIHHFFTKRFYFLRFPLCIQLNSRQYVIKLINNLALASYPVYLFHRPFWQGIINIVPERQLIQWLLIIVFGVPFLFLGGFFIQRGYNRILDELSHAIKKRKNLFKKSLYPSGL